MENDILRFLDAIDDGLVPHAAQGERLEMYLIGRSAMILSFGLSLGTKDVDFVTRAEVPPLELKALELFGKGTPNALKWGLYLETVPEGLPPVPATYRRLAKELPGDWTALYPKVLDPHHLVVTKLRRFHSGDREDLRIICTSGQVTSQGLSQALASAYPFGMDEDEDPNCKRVNHHFRMVINFLEGRTREL